MGQFSTFVANHWLLWAAFFIVALAILFLESRSKGAASGRVAPQAAIHLINREHAGVVDVRSDDEFKAGHIINSVHIPCDELEANLKKLKKYKKKPLIVVCAAGVRAQKAAKILAANEFENPIVLAGGLNAWKKASLPLESY